MDRTLILVKPDAFARGLTGEIIARFERKGLRIVAIKQMPMTKELAEQHYAEHEGKPFFGELVEFITSGPLVAMVLEGDEAVAAARQVIGATNPLEAAPARSAATSRSRSARTWSTARTRTSRRRARSGCSSPSSADAGGVADPRLALAAAAGDPRAARRRFRCGRPDVEELRTATREEVALENARRKALAASRPTPRARRRHRRRPRRRHLGKPRRRGAGAAMLGASPGRTPRGRRRHRARRATASERTARSTTRVDFRALDERPDRLVRGHRRVARPRRRLRDPGQGRRAGGGDRGRLPERRRAARRPRCSSCAPDLRRAARAPPDAAFSADPAPLGPGPQAVFATLAGATALRRDGPPLRRPASSLRTWASSRT